jgi:phytoene/squalene synthetase
MSARPKAEFDIEPLAVVRQQKEEFSREVEEFAAASDCSYLDALLEVIAKKGLEIEIVPKLISSRLKELLEQDAVDLNLLTIRKRQKLA